jgi:hypothetical protein
MSVNVTISGEIIESQNYLSNYFLTLNSDQSINGDKTFNNLNVDNLNVNNSNITTSNISTLNLYNLNISGQINTSSLDISGNYLTFNGTPLGHLYGSVDISSNSKGGTIYFGRSFDLEPSVLITQYSDRIVPLCVTNVNTSSFNWAAASSNVGKIMWSAGIKF